MEKEKKKDKLEKLSLSEAENLLDQEMDEALGGYYDCICPNGGAGV